MHVCRNCQLISLQLEESRQHFLPGQVLGCGLLWDTSRTFFSTNKPRLRVVFLKTDFLNPIDLPLFSVCISFAEKYLNFFKAVVELQSFPVAVVYFILIVASLLWKKFTSPLGLHKVAFQTLKFLPMIHFLAV